MRRCGRGTFHGRMRKTRKPPNGPARRGRAIQRAAPGARGAPRRAARNEWRPRQAPASPASPAGHSRTAPSHLSRVSHTSIPGTVPLSRRAAEAAPGAGAGGYQADGRAVTRRTRGRLTRRTRERLTRRTRERLTRRTRERLTRRTRERLTRRTRERLTRRTRERLTRRTRERLTRRTRERLTRQTREACYPADGRGGSWPVFS